MCLLCKVCERIMRLSTPSGLQQCDNITDKYTIIQHIHIPINLVAWFATVWQYSPHTHTYTFGSTVFFCNTSLRALQTVALSSQLLVEPSNTGLTRSLSGTRLVLPSWARVTVCLAIHRLIMTRWTLGTWGEGIQHRPPYQVSGRCWVLPRETFNCMGVGGGCSHAIQASYTIEWVQCTEHNTLKW